MTIPVNYAADNSRNKHRRAYNDEYCFENLYSCSLHWLFFKLFDQWEWFETWNASTAKPSWLSNQKQ